MFCSLVERWVFEMDKKILHILRTWAFFRWQFISKNVWINWTMQIKTIKNITFFNQL